MRDSITLSIPAKPDYLVTARLTASSVASRMGFDLNDIEDIKTAVAECLLIVMAAQKSKEIVMTLINDDGSLVIEVEGVAGKAPESEYEKGDGSLSRYLIEALADEAQFDEDEPSAGKIRFVKNL